MILLLNCYHKGYINKNIYNLLIFNYLIQLIHLIELN
jgi:hypothetical protein